MKSQCLLTIVAGLFATLAPPAFAIIFEVNTELDTFDTPSGTSVSLREAIRDAQASPGSDLITIAIGTNDLTKGNLFTGFGGFGGGVFADESTVVVDGCTIDQNTSAYGGGGVYPFESTATIKNTTVSNNIAEDGSGGGITVTNATLTNVTISGNTATQNGGGLRLNDFIAGAAVTLQNCTITGNTADFDNTGDGDGGGVIVEIGGTATATNTIVAGNFVASLSDDVSGTVVSSDGNLIGNGDGLTMAQLPGDQVGPPASPINPRLAPLADHGGRTATHALYCGSPAIDAGVTTTLPTDQRGLARLFGTQVDAGAYESQHEAYTFFETYAFPPGTPAAMRAPGFDFDGDRFSNALEQAFGTDPADAGSTPRIDSFGQGTDLVLEFALSKLVDPSALVFEHTIDLDTWLATGITIVPGAFIPASTRQMTRAVIPMNGQPRKFGRIGYTP